MLFQFFPIPNYYYEQYSQPHLLIGGGGGGGTTRDTHGACIPRSAPSLHAFHSVSLVPRIGSGNETNLTVQFQYKHMG